MANDSVYIPEWEIDDDDYIDDYSKQQSNINDKLLEQIKFQEKLNESTSALMNIAQVSCKTTRKSTESIADTKLEPTRELLNANDRPTFDSEIKEMLYSTGLSNTNNYQLAGTSADKILTSDRFFIAGNTKKGPKYLPADHFNGEFLARDQSVSDGKINATLTAADTLTSISTPTSTSASTSTSSPTSTSTSTAVTKTNNLKIIDESYYSFDRYERPTMCLPDGLSITPHHRQFSLADFEIKPMKKGKKGKHKKKVN